MKVAVKRDDCIGCGLCTKRCPEVFVLDDEKTSKVIADPVPAKFEDIVKGIVDSCPTNAISIKK